MKRTALIVILVLSLTDTVVCQAQYQDNRKELLKSIEYSNPDLLASPLLNAPGFPSRKADLDALPGFRTPPPGYGEVPFWWWSGDPLEKDRLLWQIEELHKKGINGMQINYIHKDTPGWPTYPAEPEIFSDEWWSMWKFAADEAGKRSMGIGMSGYTIDWPKSDNLFNKIIYSDQEIQGRELVVDTIIKCLKGNKSYFSVPHTAIQVWAYRIVNGKIIPGGKSLSAFINNNILTWEPGDDDWEIWVYAVKRHPGTLNPIHPLSGKTVIDKFFQQFEDHSNSKTSEGLNYFFQDELKFGVGDLIWTDDFNDVFRKLKGYNVFENLPAMFRDIGPVTSKARLDFMDVKVQLSEERYFKPIFEWHWKRGKIYGCDPEGRGKEPGNYGDNFRAIRWYSAPGHDTPSGNADLIKGKVSSSIAALYKRPRVWLEGYHSLGWGATPEQIMFATNENYLYGCNLLNLHGLYYTTHGSYWEWAPPCYHFRMPYWDHMTVFLKYFERLSYLLSQGVLQADIAVLYPVSTAQAKMNEEESVSTAFKSGTNLFNNGYDFLFIDDQSVIRSEIQDGRLTVSDQSFKILILPDMKALRWSTLTRALDFYHQGGIVIAVGSLPEASDNAGSLDPALDKIVRELFGATSAELKSGLKPSLQKDNSGGSGLFIAEESNLVEIVGRFLQRQVWSDSRLRYMHRKIGFRDVFMIMGTPKNSWVTFRAKGKAELWDPWTGKNLPLNDIKETIDGTMVKMPLDSAEAQLIVFTPYRDSIKDDYSDLQLKSEISGNPSFINLDGKWEFELKPTMDNQWGDFRLPVTDKMIGAEARIFRYAEEKGESNGWELPEFDDSKWELVKNGFGQKFWKLGPLPDISDQLELDRKLSKLISIDPSVPVNINGKSYFWVPYNFSWRFGVEGDPGHQGYHGLKEEITDEFICLGKPTSGLNETLYKEEDEGTLYYLWTSAYSENVTNVTIDSGGLIPSSIYLNGNIISNSSKELILVNGSNPLLVKYNKPGRGHFVLLKKESNLPSERTPLSMKWWDIKGRIPFDVFPSRRTPAGWYRFTAPPGLKSIKIRSDDNLKIWINGIKSVVKTLEKDKSFKVVNLQAPLPENSKVAIRIEHSRGNYGGSALPEPISVSCSSGFSHTGDWSQGSILENYSGGAWYRKKIVISEKEINSAVVIDLGKVVATAEIHINDSLAGILVTEPWRTDISKYLRAGENKIEILVYNTLANHYLTIPTKYRGNSLKSGLLGPVKIEFYPRIIKK